MECEFCVWTWMKNTVPNKFGQDWEGYFGNVIGYRLLVAIFKV